MMKLYLKVSTNAKVNLISDAEIDYLGEKYKKAYVTTIPENGKANDAIVKLISKKYNVAKSKIHFISGEKSHYKIFEIDL